MRRKHKVPEILWRLFRDRARPMAETIVSLLPPSPKQCKCKGKQCLGCSVDPLSFLLRPDDPSDYRKLLIRCFVVVSDNAPALRVFFPHCHWSQYERNCSSPTVELLSCSSWDLLQSRVGDDMMVYILRNTSIFLPVPRRKHHQVAGPPVSGLCFKMSNCLSNLDSRHSSLPQGALLKMDWVVKRPAPYQRASEPTYSGRPNQMGKIALKELDLGTLEEQRNQKKRERTGDTDSTVGKRRCNTSIIFNGPACSASGLDFTGLKSSMPLTRHDGSEHHQTSSANVSKSSTGKCAGKHIAESEGEKSSDYPTARIRKRSRPFSWQRRQKRRQKLCSAETSTTTDCLHGSFHCSETSLSHHEKPSSQKDQAILEYSPFPELPILCPQIIDPAFQPQQPSDPPQISPDPDLNLQTNQTLDSTRPLQVYSRRKAPPPTSEPVQSSPSDSQDVEMLDSLICFDILNRLAFSFHIRGYHSLVKLFKRVIRRTQCCQYKKLLDKHCAVPPWNQDPIGRSNSPHEGNVSEIGVQKKMHGFDSKHSVDTLEAIDSQHEAVKSYCSKSQVVSYIWAVSRSVLPPELLGNASQRRIMRRNIFKFICLRRFEKSHLKLCMQGLKTSIFPFLTTKYFSNSQDAQILKCAEGHNRGLDKEFRNWNHAVHVIKRKLLERWIFWYFSCLVVPLVQANFYVTESQHGKQDIYYYRKSVWEKLTNSTIACLEDGRYSYQNRKDGRYSHLDDVAVRNILMGRPFGFSKLRIRPKENGVRMVANLNSSSRLPSYMSSRNVQSSKMWRKANHLKSKFDHYQSVNFVLHDAHIILKDIQFKEPEKLGSSVFDYNDVYKKIGQFLIGLKEGSKSKPNFYIVISDVLKAFDSVDQDKLLDVMNEVLPKREYLLKQHDQVVCTKKSLWVRKHLSVRGENMCPGSEGFTSSASSHFLGTIFVNQVLEWPFAVHTYCLLASYMYELIKRRMHSIRSRCDFRPVLKLEKGEVEWLGLHAYVQVLKRKQSRHKDLLAILSSRLHSHRISSGVSPELMHAVDPSNSSILWNIKY
ncbi:telomerase reverse transcriptase [Senna tora]|uniref:Telomerase reverse transcriptase n=1 Tax=Senna tora TaxID=362788 RepID=A0A834XFM1_9FABA|nr:telomerase reverse transcriptase [Senna tora]